MRNRVPGYLGNTNYWFGNAGLGSSRREKRNLRRQQQQEMLQLKRQQQAVKAKQQAVKAKQRQASRPPTPRPVVPPTITPKAAPPAAASRSMMTPRAMTPGGPPSIADEQALMAELESLTGGADTGGDGMMMDTGGGGGGGPPPGTPALTVEELILQREEMAAKVAADLAEQYKGKPVPQSVLDSAMAKLPPMPIPIPKRPGFIGVIMDAIFGPPPPIL